MSKLSVPLLFVFFSLTIPFTSAFALSVSDRFRSPRNPERKVRASTELIVLHTTEAPARSSLNKVSDRGECHFVVTESGGIYRIVDRDREAFHAGRSMWNGREDVDKFSVGIECVGYHDKPMPDVQLKAIADLVRELKAMYRIPDERVVAHSHVAYGAPNRWHRYKHRGRKRCGMLFAMPSVRRRLGLKSKPAYDADVRARRLRQADPDLAKVLYGNVDTMRSRYGGGGVVVASAPAPQRTVVPKSPAPQRTTSAKPAVAPRKATPPSGSMPRSVAELKARGYSVRGQVGKNRTALQIAGSRWNSADTFYTIRDKVFPGSTINPSHIENGMKIWMRK